MKNCPKNPDVQDYGCGALSNLAVNNDNNHSTIAKEGGVETIRSAMASHSNNARVQNHGQAALLNLAVNDDNKIAIAEQEEGYINNIDAQTLNEHGVQTELLKNGRYCCPDHTDTLLRQKNWMGVWKTVQDSCPKCDHERMNKQGQPTTQTSTMPQQPSSLPATQSQPSTQIPTTANQIDKIISMLKMNERNADILGGDLLKLAHFAENNDDNQKKIVEGGGNPLFMTAMNKHLNKDAYVQYSGCGALMKLAENRDNQMTIAEAGGITSIVSAMKIHPEFPYVQEYGCGALWNLALNDGNKGGIADEGGIAAIVVAMKKHPENPNVQEYGCATLRNLALNVDNQLMIADNGGIASGKLKETSGNVRKHKD